MKRIALLLVVLSGLTATARAENWSFWRGPEQNGVSRDTNLPDTFSLDAKKRNNNVIWRVPYGGITTPVVQNGRIYIITRVGDEDIEIQERVLCFEEKTGKKVWEQRFNVFLTDIVRDRLGWTSMVGDPQTGNVYAHGTQGFLFCYDGKDGKILWRHSLTEEYGRVSGYGGRLTSPIIDGDLLILCVVNASWGEQTVGGTRFVAFDKRTGEVVWWASSGYQVKDTHSCVPVVAVINGERLLICGGGDGGVHAFRVRTGEKVWSYIFGTGAVNASPVVKDNYVYIGHGEGNPDNNEQGRVICLDAGTVKDGQPKLVWQVDGIKAKFGSPILHEGRLYIPNETARLYCLDAMSGDTLWNQTYGRQTKGSPVWADGKIYVGEVDSKFHILKPGENGCRKLASVFFRSKSGVPVELKGSPAIANGRIYFLTTEELVCIGKPDGLAADRLAVGPAEDKEVGKAASLQVVPADVTLTAGQSVEFKVRAFDKHGRLVGETEADWELAGPLPPVFPIGMTAPTPPGGKRPPPPALKGELESQHGKTTKLTVGNVPAGQFGRVVARAKGLTCYARIRMAPILPYAMNFSGVPVGGIPGGWVNCQGKFSVVKLQGKNVLKKRNDVGSPLVARATAFITTPDTRDYTMEADIQGEKSHNDLPDMGVEVNRYRLFLEGNTQKLRLVSWDALPRIDETISYPWKPGVWYHMKLTTQIKGGKGTVRGKVWEAGKPEPKEWTVEVEDPRPNFEGSAGLYGFAAGTQGPSNPGSTVYYSNVRITPNPEAR
jgi:outer membrane protein assembly factor BamB